MYALTYCFEGVDDSLPYACTLIVSEDLEKVTQYMNNCVEEDCKYPTCEEDEWNTDCNYSVWKKCDREVSLQHNKNINLYATYKIHSVKTL
jgi:hypothetical protein